MVYEALSRIEIEEANSWFDWVFGVEDQFEDEISSAELKEILDDLDYEDELREIEQEWACGQLDAVFMGP